MKFHFTQEECESKMSKGLEYGDELKIAERMNKNTSLIQQMCSPNDERESYFYNAARFIVSEMDVSFERGCYLLRLFNSLVELHIPCDSPGCPKQETTELLQEWSQFLDCAIQNKPLIDQIDELDDVIAQALELKKAKQAELKRETSRDFARSIVSNGNGKSIRS